jgi:hypothetical protein
LQARAAEEREDQQRPPAWLPARVKYRRTHANRERPVIPCCRWRRHILPVGLFVLLSCGTADAQPSLALGADVTFYGDNTEFRNPFREGETIFGAALRLSAISEVSDRIAITIGAFGNQRFGSDDGFELVRPILSLTVSGRRSRFVFGTFPVRSPETLSGPDLDGPHRLLPPIQRETLAFDRPYEAGLQWTFAGAHLTHDMWLEWQRLNTPEHRERFDGGFNARISPGGLLSFPIQVHIVHEGGQLFSSGPVADSGVISAGLRIAGRPLSLDSAALELIGLASRFVPNRAQDNRTRDGGAFFGRAEAEKRGWRAHLIVWRGKNFIKEEGDPNYQSIQRVGEIYRGTRDYAEAGVTRTFQLAPGVALAASGRLHRIENHYEYSYRVLALTSLRWRVR